MIRREDVADLRDGDVVEYHHWDWPGGITVRGVLYKSQSGCLMIGNDPIRLEDGDVRSGDHWQGTLTVVSRAPRPLYVNHPRTEPVEHDVVRDGRGVIRHHGPVSDSTDPTWWSWEVEPGFRWTWTSTPPQPLTLLVDGTTGQVVQS